MTADSLRLALELKSVVDHHAMVDIADARGIIREVNERFCRVFQYDREELVGRDHRILNSGRHSARFFETMWTKIAAGEVWRGDIRNRARDGSHVWVETTIVPILDGDGRPREYYAIRTDVSEKKRSEQALRDSEEQLRLALRGAHAGAWRWTIGTGAAVWSPETFALRGCDPATVEPSHAAWLESVHPDDRAAVRTAVARALEGAQSTYAAEYRVILPTGEIRWIEDLGAVERSSAGEPVRVAGISLDVTERKTSDFVVRASEAALRQSQARLRHAADAARLTYAEFDFAANRGVAADNYLVVMGYSPLREDGGLDVDAALARLIAHVAPEDRRQVQERVGAALTGKSPVVEAEYRVIGDDGATRWIRSVGTVEAGPNGFPRRIFVANLDVTKQVAVQEALRRATEKADEILSSIADGFFALDPDWRFVYVNDRAEALLATPREKAVGRAFLEVCPGLRDGPVHAGLARVMEGRAPQEFEARGPGADRWTFYSVYPTREGGVSVYFRDISDRKRIEAEIVAARNEAERANRAKSKFLAAASHDLRQPVQSLALLTGLAEQKLADAPEAKATLDLMRKSLDGLNSLLSAILDISRFDAGVEAHPEPVRLAEILRRLFVEYEPRAREAGLTLRVVTPDLWACADQALLERAIRNLVDNAIRYTRKGGVVVGLRRRKGRVRIDVVDTGVGVPRDRQADIFDEFVQIDNPGRRLGLGLGLGLAIVSRIAKLIGATVEVSSNGGRGSRFSLLVPAAEAAKAGSSVAAAGPDPGGRVLVVEDNALVSSSLGAALLGWGYEPVLAASGEEALRMAEAARWRFSAVMADQHLGEGMSGVETARELRRRCGRRLPALILTGDTTREGILDIAASGFRILHKPIAPDLLRRSLASLVREGC